MNEEKEITKPSLTQRRKITGIKDISEDSPMKPKIMGMDESSEDVSIVKVGGVILAVIVVAVVAAFLIISLQGGDDKENKDNNTTPTPTVTVAPTSTDNNTQTSPTPTPIVTVTPSPQEDDDDDTPGVVGQFGQGSQSLTSTATALEYRIRTYQWTNESTYYEFNLPLEKVSGTSDNPSVKASYNAENDLILEVENITQFTSCTYLNENNSNMTYGNVNKVSCEKQGNKFVFTIDTTTKTDFKLSFEEREIAVNKEKVNAIVVQVKNK